MLLLDQIAARIAQDERDTRLRIARGADSAHEWALHCARCRLLVVERDNIVRAYIEVHSLAIPPAIRL